MYSKVIGIILSLVFVIIAWYLYAMYSYTQNLIFALLASIIAFVAIVSNYNIFNKQNGDKEVEKSVEIARAVFTGIAFLALLIYFVLSAKLGGSAAEDPYASWRYENYEVGKYYLSSHGNFTLVTYTTWIRMKILERIVIPIFFLVIVWNFIHGVKTDGIIFMITGDIKHINTNEKNSTYQQK